MNILNIVFKDLKIIIKNKMVLILLLVMPVLMIALMGYALKPVFEIEDKIEKFEILYSNEDRGELGKNFYNYLKNEGKDLFNVNSINTEKIEGKISDEKYNIAIVVLNTHTQYEANVENTTIKIISSGRNPVEEAVVTSFIKTYTQAVNRGIGLAKIHQENTEDSELIINTILHDTQTKYGMTFVKSQQIDKGITNNITSYQFFATSMLIFFLLTSGMGLGGDLIDDRENKTFKRIHSFPIKQREYLIGKIIGNGFISIIQAIFIMLFARWLFKVEWGNQMGGLFLIVILIIFISSALGVIFSSLFNSSKALTSAMTVFIWLMTFVSGGFTVSPIGIFEKFTINKWAFDGIIRLIKGNSLIDIWVNLTILIIIATILWVIGVTLYNRRKTYE
jgi:ABC-2 type transport system permease protein